MKHAKSYGRIAFSIPHADLLVLNQKIKDSGEKILTDLVSLDTPGKATVTVVILADPVGFWIYHLSIMFCLFRGFKKKKKKL